MHRGQVTRTILECLADAAMDMGDLFVALNTAGYGSSTKRLQIHKEKARERREAIMTKISDEIACRRRYYKTLHALRRDGLITYTNPAAPKTIREKVIKLTAKGKGKLAELQKRFPKLPPTQSYRKISGGPVTIVVFDIPESERRKRAWLRDVLRRIGFALVQKSVWIGQVKIPQGLLKDLRTMRIIKFVEIFEITKRGTLSHVT